MTFRSRIAAIFLLSFIGLAYLFAWSPIFTVKAINTVGLPAGINKVMVIQKSKIEIGEKLARIEPRSVENNLSEITWIKSVSVARNWIDGEVTITVAARKPVGLYRGRAIDSSGALFDFAGKRPKGLPTVSAATPEIGLSAISLFTNLPGDLRGSLISMGATSSSTISSWHRLDGRNIKISWGSTKDLALKVSVYRALIALPENQTIRRVDLSAPHAPIVK